MPGRNGTGPQGFGPGTGRGMGYCSVDSTGPRGLRGRNWSRTGKGGAGFGFRFGRGRCVQSDDLNNYQRYLQEELSYVNNRLNRE